MGDSKADVEAAKDENLSTSAAKDSDSTKPVKAKRKFFNPVDKGWSWVILASVFFIATNTMGTIRSFGVLFVPIQQAFGAEASAVSLIPGIQAAFYSACALVTMTLLIEVMSLRNIIRLGGLLLALGYSVCYLATSVPFFYVFQGFIGGIGMAMAMGPGFVLLSNYFERRRALAVAIANAGGSMGTLLLPHIMRALLGEFFLSGTYLLMGGLLAQNVVLACFLTPPEDYKPRTNICGDTKDDPTSAALLDNENTHTTKALLDNETTQYSDKTTIFKDFSKEKEGRERPTYNQEGSMECSRQDSNDPSTGGESGKISKEEQRLLNEEADELFEMDDLRPRTHSESNTMNIHFTSQQNGSNYEKPSRPRYTRSQSEEERVAFSRARRHENCAKKRTSRASGDFDDVLMFASCETLHMASQNTTAVPHEVKPDEVNKDTESQGRCRRLISLCFDPVLFKSPLFWLLMAFMSFGILASMVVAFLPPLAYEKGLIMSESNLLLTVIGALDIVSRLVPGFVAQMEWLKPQTMDFACAKRICVGHEAYVIDFTDSCSEPTNVVLISVLILGTVCQFTAFYNSLGALMGMAVVVGLTAGVFVSMVQLIIIDFVGLANFPRAFGMVQIGTGIMISATHPLLGYLRDVTGTFVVPFHVIGAFLYLSGGLILLEPCVRRMTHSLSS